MTDRHHAFSLWLAALPREARYHHGYGDRKDEAEMMRMAWEAAVLQEREAYIDATEALIIKKVAEEREACAVLCENYEGSMSECMGDIEGILGAKIRSRAANQKEPG